MYYLYYVTKAFEPTQSVTLKNTREVRRFLLKNAPEIWEIFKEDWDEGDSLNSAEVERKLFAHNNLRKWGPRKYIDKIEPDKPYRYR